MSRNGLMVVGAIGLAFMGAKAASAAPANVVFGGDGQGASLYSYAYVYADATGNSGVPFGQNYTGGNDSSLVLPAAPLTATASYVTTSDAQGALSAFTAGSSTASAAFNTSSAGQIDFSGTLSATVDSDNGYTISDTPQFFEYVFTPLQNAVLNISYNFSLTGSNIPSLCFYLCNREIQLQDYSDYTYYTILDSSKYIYSDINQNGILSMDLDKGKTYELVFDDSYTIEGCGSFSPAYECTFTNAVGGMSSSSLSYQDRYSFSIDAVSAAPEPSAWTLLIAGVAVAGAALRFGRRGWAAA